MPGEDNIPQGTTSLELTGVHSSLQPPSKSTFQNSLIEQVVSLLSIIALSTKGHNLLFVIAKVIMVLQTKKMYANISLKTFEWVINLGWPFVVKTSNLGSSHKGT